MGTRENGEQNQGAMEFLPVLLVLELTHEEALLCILLLVVVIAHRRYVPSLTPKHAYVADTLCLSILRFNYIILFFSKLNDIIFPSGWW